MSIDDPTSAGTPIPTTERPSLRLVVPDSGRTWLVDYDEITFIPPALYVEGTRVFVLTQGPSVWPC